MNVLKQWYIMANSSLVKHLIVQNKQFHLSTFRQVTKEFEDAKEKLSDLNEDPGSDVKLKIYGFFKQVREKHSVLIFFINILINFEA